MNKLNKKLSSAALALAILAGTVCSCKDKPARPTVGVATNDTTAVAQDSTIYGMCGEGTTMHTLQLICDDGSVHNYMINMDDSLDNVKGGLLAGDRMAVTAHTEYGDTIADVVVNLTTLMGRWMSIDKNFEIKDGGVVKSNVESETAPWTSWKIFNGQLVLNKDTFSIYALGADSMLIENNAGLFGYKRVTGKK